MDCFCHFTESLLVLRSSQAELDKRIARRQEDMAIRDFVQRTKFPEVRVGHRYCSRRYGQFCKISLQGETVVSVGRRILSQARSCAVGEAFIQLPTAGCERAAAARLHVCVKDRPFSTTFRLAELHF